MVRKARLWLTALVGVAALPLAALAQERTTITGTVRAAGGAPISAAQVVAVGRNASAVTAANGTYRLLVPNGSTVTLRASKVGFAAQTAQVSTSGAAVTQNFTLPEQAVSLDELVVTGSPSGTAQRREVPNAVSRVSATEVVERVPSVTNVTAVLQSRVPGLQVVPASGVEGTASRVRIRGVGSISAGTSPVYVIDGVRFFGGTQGGYDVGGQSQSALDAIDPQDIESIEVIKGPAAATLYGADAANGVIQVSTKKGQPGQQRIRYNGSAAYGEQDWNARTFTNYTLCNDARIATATSTAVGSFPGCLGKTPGSLISADLLKDDPNALRTGHTRTFHLDATGGGERFGFYISGNANNNDGIFENNTFERMGTRANFTILPSDQFDANINFAYSRNHTQLPLSDNASNGITRNANRGIPGRQGPFAIGWLGLSPNEVGTYDNETRADRFITSATLRYRPTSWFTNRITGGFDQNVRNNELFYRRDQTGLAPYGAVAATGAVYQYKPIARLFTFDYAGTVTAEVNRDLSSETSFGSQVIANRFESLEGSGEGFLSDRTSLIGAASLTTAFEGLTEQSTVGFFVQQKFGWRDRLFVTAGLRADDNSAFGEDYTFVAYPKLGASYVLSEEPFFSVPSVDQFRLRAAWGRAGTAPAPYAAERNFAIGQVVQGDLTATSGLLASNFGNPELRAEEGSEYELGADASLFGGRIGVDFTYYNKTTRDVLIPVSAAPSSGFTAAVSQNVGQISNRGTELALDILAVESRNFTWTSRINHSTLHNQLDNFGGVRDQPITLGFVLVNGGQWIRPGAPIPQFYGTSPSRDANGALLRNPNGSLITDRDTTFFGGTLPTRTLSWDNNFRIFRNFRVGGQLDYQGGHYQLNLTKRTRARDGILREVADPAADTIQRRILLSDALGEFIEKADFVKLREISASYTVPGRFTRSFGSDQMVLSVSARNLKTWTDYTGTDPEVNADGGESFTQTETNGIPAPRRITASINVRF